MKDLLNKAAKLNHNPKFTFFVRNTNGSKLNSGFYVDRIGDISTNAESAYQQWQDLLNSDKYHRGQVISIRCNGYDVTSYATYGFNKTR